MGRNDLRDDYIVYRKNNEKYDYSLESFLQRLSEYGNGALVNANFVGLKYSFTVKASPSSHRT